MNRLKRVHVVGAGMAGLAAAVKLADAGLAVRVYETAQAAGGRCRSYLNATLGCRIDNGNHLLLTGNHAAMGYVGAIGARDTLIGPIETSFPFLDVATGERWVVRPGEGRVPWWVFDRTRRVAGTRISDHLAALALLRAGPERTVGELFDQKSVLFRRFLAPLTVAALNTGVEDASAALLARVLRESFFRGGTACRPLVPRDGLSESLVDPALAHLARKGGEVRLLTRLRRLEFAADRVAALGFETGNEGIAADDAVILAVPAPVATRLIPGLDAPDEFRAIVNAHYRARVPETAPFFVGVIGGTTEWVFRKREVLSVTVSAADRLIEIPTDELAHTMWREVERAYQLPPGPMPPVQIVKERRATFAATPAQQKRRPPAQTRWRNLALAGDWTDTGLPATIEGAIRSGTAAAESLLGA